MLEQQKASLTKTVAPALTRQEKIPFSTFSPAQVEDSIQALLESTTTEFEKLKNSAEPLTFESVMVPFDDFDSQLSFASSVVGHLESVCTSEELRITYNAVLPKIAEIRSNLVLDDGLWSLISRYAESSDAKSLDGHRARFVKKTLEQLKRAGANLPQEKKLRLAAIAADLSKLTSQFSQKTLDATNAFEFITTDEKYLSGLPESARAMAKASAESKNVSGFRFTLQAPSYIGVLTYADSRELREKMYTAYNGRCYGDQFDTTDLIVQIVNLRHERAQLLGFSDFANLNLVDRMAKNLSGAKNFVDDLRSKVELHFQREHKELTSFVSQEFPSAPQKLEPWDMTYYAEKMRQKLYEFDDEVLRPYFEFERVLDGLFTIVDKTFGISVKPQSELETWHDSVTAYSAYDSNTGELLGHFYADFFPRESKRGGAWMDSFNSRVVSSRDGLPHIGVIAGNFTPPVSTNPSLLTHDEVCTLFHEFGHLMHLLCTATELRSQSMTAVAWDFIELPSQILENWCWERESLDLFARHFETNEVIPDELFNKMRRARSFRAGSHLMRQVGISSVDQALHCGDPIDSGSVVQKCRQIMQQHNAATIPESASFISTLTHLFGDAVGYAAGYYSYQWAEVLDADAFTRFLSEGLLAREVGERFRSTILSKGDSEEPDSLFREFMERDPSIDALMIRCGLKSH